MQGCHECGRFWVHYAELVFHNRGVPLELGDLCREFIGEDLFFRVTATIHEAAAAPRPCSGRAFFSGGPANQLHKGQQLPAAASPSLHEHAPVSVPAMRPVQAHGKPSVSWRHSRLSFVPNQTVKKEPLPCLAVDTVFKTPLLGCRSNFTLCAGRMVALKCSDDLLHFMSSEFLWCRM